MNAIQTLPTTWTMHNWPPDMVTVEVWDLTGATLAYRDQGVWRDAVTGIPLAHNSEITHWRRAEVEA